MKNVCLNYICLGSCSISNCRFEHDDTMRALVPTFRKKAPCPRMIRSRGTCDEPNCPYSHAVRNFEELEEAMHLVRETGKKNLELADGEEEGRSARDGTVSARQRLGQGANSFCMDFAAYGSCRGGASCKYSHDPADLAAIPTWKGALPCPKFVMTGGCTVAGCSLAHTVSGLRNLSDIYTRVKATGIREQEPGFATAAKPRAVPPAVPEQTSSNLPPPVVVPPPLQHPSSPGHAPVRERTPKATNKRNRTNLAERIPCLWFPSPQGCQKGSNCPAAHDAGLVPLIDGKLPCPRSVWAGRCTRAGCNMSHRITSMAEFIDYYADFVERGGLDDQQRQHRHQQFNQNHDQPHRARSPDFHKSHHQQHHHAPRHHHKSTESVRSISEEGKQYPSFAFEQRARGVFNPDPEQPLYNRYTPISRLGKGVYAKVIQAFDMTNSSTVALKVFRGGETYTAAAVEEMTVLEKLQKASGGNDYCFLGYNNFITGQIPHHAISFPICGPSVFDVLRQNTVRLRSGSSTARHSGFPLDMVRSIAFQLLRFVSFASSQGVIHTDIKPENVLFASNIPFLQTAQGQVRPSNTAIKVIDMGNAILVNPTDLSLPASAPTDCQTRHYRAPEVIVDSKHYSFGIDVWSVATMIPELLMGETIFMMHDNLEHFALMEKVIGPFPHVSQMPTLAQSRRFGRYFDTERSSNSMTTAVRWPPHDADPEDLRYVEKQLPLRESILRALSPDERAAGEQLVDLLQRMLKYEPRERIQATDALKHPFFEGYM